MKKLIVLCIVLSTAFLITFIAHANSDTKEIRIMMRVIGKPVIDIGNEASIIPSDKNKQPKHPSNQAQPQ